MTEEQPSGHGIDASTPNVARIWDHQLGGKDNFLVDREAAAALNEACRRAGAPDGRDVARENRAFIRRAVRYLAGPAGIEQFLDLGAGLPTRGNVHEIAQSVNPAARTVYVDYDPMVLAHGRALLADNTNTVVVQADIRDPDTILGDPELRLLLDLDRPIAVLVVAVLHLFTADEAPAGIVARFRDALAPGSHVAITHVTNDSRPDVAEAVANQFLRLGVTTPLVPRTAHQIAGLFDGFDMVEPGLVHPAAWRPDVNGPDPGPDTRWMYAGVGRLAAPERRPPASQADAHPGARNSHSWTTGPSDRRDLINRTGNRDPQRTGFPAEMASTQAHPQQAGRRRPGAGDCGVDRVERRRRAGIRIGLLVNPASHGYHRSS